jgi:signal transduction histidine kinase
MNAQWTVAVPLFWIGTGIAVITTLQAAIIAALGHSRRLFGTFAAVCVCAVAIIGSSAVYYSAATAHAAGLAMRWHMAGILLAIPLVHFYIAEYTGGGHPPLFRAMIVATSVLFVVNWQSPYSVRFSSLEVLAPGDFAVTPGPWQMLIRALVLTLMVWGFRSCWIQFRAGDRRDAIFLTMYLGSLLVAFVWSTVIDYGYARRYYLGGWSFLIIQLLMSMKLGIDLRDRDRGIRRAAAEWKETFNSIRAPILLTCTRGVILRANRAACELLGERPTGLGCAEPWKTARRMIEESSEQCAVVGEARDGEGRTWELTLSRFSSVAEREGRCVLALWDITSIVGLQESLRKRERISAMGALLGGVAHEVRNPLFGISATLDAYEEELKATDLRDFVDVLRGEVKRLITLMQDLLDFGKPASLAIDREGVETVIQEAITRFSARGVEVRTEIHEELPPLVIDRPRLRQVFENLIENATQHSEPGAAIVVSAVPVEQGGRCWVECRVDDSGRGFIAGDLERVFDPFYTRREGGTGLGLSIVQRIVEDHAGHVSASNRPEGGASVSVRLPIPCN